MSNLKALRLTSPVSAFQRRWCHIHYCYKLFSEPKLSQAPLLFSVKLININLVNGLHLHSAVTPQSTLQWPLIHPVTHFQTPMEAAAACPIGSNLVLSVLPKDTTGVGNELPIIGQPARSSESESLQFLAFWRCFPLSLSSWCTWIQLFTRVAHTFDPNCIRDQTLNNSSLCEILSCSLTDDAGKELDTTYNLEPKTRANFLQCTCNNSKTLADIRAAVLIVSLCQPAAIPDSNDITLDPDTANPYLSFSNGRREVTTRSEPQPYPDHPSRFSSWAQVLCRAGMAGRCYWEVEWGGAGGVSIGVCYKSMGRSGGGSDCKLGHNPKSWSLDCSHSVCSFQHNKESASVSAAPCSRIGVYLDFRGGALSFYNVSEQMVLLHKARATFSQPVYPGFWVGLGSYLKLCSL